MRDHMLDKGGVIVRALADGLVMCPPLVIRDEHIDQLVDAVAAEAKTSQDPQALARSVLDQALSGNMASIDALVASQRSLQTRMAQVVPPPSCREHHERSVALFARSVALLDRTRAAMSGQGTTDLSAIAVEGRGIEEEARAVDAMANDLRRAAGLAPVS